MALDLIFETFSTCEIWEKHDQQLAIFVYTVKHGIMSLYIHFTVLYPPAGSSLPYRTIHTVKYSKTDFPWILPYRDHLWCAPPPPFLWGWKFHKSIIWPWNPLGRFSPAARLRIRVWWSGHSGGHTRCTGSLTSTPWSRISESANPHRDFVIASQGEMASFPAGTTPFLLEIESALGIPCKKSPVRSMTQLTSSTPTLRRSDIPCPQFTEAQGWKEAGFSHPIFVLGSGPG
jgi:hypothetical protein